MDLPILPLSLIVFFALAGGYFSLMETALTESRHGRIEKLANDGNVDAQAVLKILESPQLPLSVAQVGMTVAGIIIGFCSMPLSIFIFGRINFFEEARIVSIVVALVVVSAVIILFGEFLPRRAAQLSPEKFLLSNYKSFRIITAIFSPPIIVFSKIADGAMMLFGVNADNSADVVTEDEVKDLIEQGTEDGTFEESERAMVDNIFHLSDQTAYALMTPRIQMVWLDISDSVEQNLKIIKESTQNIFPVGEGSLDECRGVIYVKDVLNTILDKREVDLHALIKKPIFVPRTMETFRLVEKFKASGDSVAIVNDEYGGVIGFITLDDIAEEIVGIKDISMPEEKLFVQRKANSWMVAGLYDIDDFKQHFGIETLPYEDDDHFQTMGGFVTSQFGYIPKVGEFREWNGFRFEVKKMDGARIDKILVTKIDNRSD